MSQMLLILVIAYSPRQPLFRIINLSYPRVSVLPEGEEFLVMLYGFGLD